MSSMIVSISTNFFPKGIILDKLEIEDFRRVINNKNLKDFKRMGKNSKKFYFSLERNNDFYKLMNMSINDCARS